MSKEDRLEKWRPCRHMCSLAGALSFFLSIEDCAVIINGPRWCAMFAEREAAAFTARKAERLYCSEITELDLLYGVEGNLLDVMDDISARTEISLVAVLNSCSMSLIGDDVAGICGRTDRRYKLVALDANGLGGDFWDGYNKAAEALLDTLPMQSAAACERCVNLLSVSGSYPNWRADLDELKRWLQVAGLEIGICPGEAGLTLNDYAATPRAALNVVIQPELGLRLAERLQNATGQPYLLANVPYGLSGSESWLSRVAAALGCPIELAAVRAEMAKLQDETSHILSRRGDMHDRPTTFSRIMIAGPSGMATGLANALCGEFPDRAAVYLKIVGPLAGNSVAGGWQAWDLRTIPKYPRRDQYFLLLGSEFERYECGLYQRTVYKGLCAPVKTFGSTKRPYAGPAGWGNLLSGILEDLQSLVKITATYKY